MGLNKAACEAAVGAFMERLTDKPTTGDMLAALRFALEAYESVRVAPAPASQLDVEVAAALGAATVALVSTLQKIGWSAERINNDELIQYLHEVMKQAQTSRAQRTAEEKNDPRNHFGVGMIGS